MADEAQARETDTQLAKLHGMLQTTLQGIDAVKDSIHFGVHDRHVWHGRRQAWTMTDGQAIEKAMELAKAGKRGWGNVDLAAKLAKLAEYRETAEKIGLQIEELDAVYLASPWPRYFPCLTRDGHIHSTLRACSSVRWDTAMGWEPELSGKPVADAVAKLGEALCTHCFKDAPSQWKSKTLGQVKDERTRAEREAAKAERDRIKYAKRLFDSEVFRVDRRFGDKVETVAACKDVLRKEVEFRDNYGRGPTSDHAAYVEAAGQATRVLLTREERLAGTGATQAEIDRIIANAIKRNRADGARI